MLSLESINIKEIKLKNITTYLLKMPIKQLRKKELDGLVIKEKFMTAA